MLLNYILFKTFFIILNILNFKDAKTIMGQRIEELKTS